MGINFPATPVVDQLHPDPAVAGIPQYKWNGTAWVANTPQDALSYVKRSGDTMTGHLSLPTSPAAANAVRKDYVDAYAAPLDALAYNGMQVNGSMEVSQEGVAATVNGKYACDGWVLHFNGIPGSQLVQDSAASVPGFPSRIYAATSTAKPSLAAADYLTADQHIEGYRVHRLGWGTANAQPITIGFWTQHTLPGTYSVSIRNATTYNRCYVTTYTQNIADVLEYKIITIPGDTVGTWGTIHGVGMSISFCAASGSTYIAPSANTWLTGNYVAASGQMNVAAATTYMVLRGVVVLPGIYAPTAAQSPLIMRPYDQELLTCQRYYNRVIGGLQTMTAINAYYSVAVHLPVTMRSTPTVAFVSHVHTLTGFATPFPELPEVHGFRVTAQANASTNGSFGALFSADARL